MRAHYFQHEAFEDTAAIGTWLQDHGFEITGTRFFESDALPAVEDIDWLVIMGGAMSVNDEARLPWLVREKEFVRQCIAAQKVVVGVCLGAQMIASALGAAVYRNSGKEIGWFPVEKSGQSGSLLFQDFPERLHVFHWHGETFDLPKGADLVARSETTRHQIFTYGNRVVGFQCHLETTPASLASLSKACHAELIPAPRVQTHDEMMAGTEKYIAPMHKALFGVLERLL